MRRRLAPAHARWVDRSRGARLEHPQLMHEPGGGGVIVGAHGLASPTAPAYGDVRGGLLHGQRMDLVRGHRAVLRADRADRRRRFSLASVARRSPAWAITARMVRARSASFTTERSLAAIGLDHLCMVAFPTARDEPR
jgi:hypothetical protein